MESPSCSPISPRYTPVSPEYSPISPSDPRHEFHIPPPKSTAPYEPTTPRLEQEIPSPSTSSTAPYEPTTPRSPAGTGMMVNWNEYSPPPPPKISAAPRTRIKEREKALVVEENKLKRKAEELDGIEEEIEAREARMEEIFEVKELFLSLEKRIKELEEQRRD